MDNQNDPNAVLLPAIFLSLQIALLGITAGLATVAGNTVFLSAFGAANLPWAFVATGPVVAAVFFGLATAQTRFTFSQLAYGALGGLGVVLLVAALLIARPGMAWWGFVIVVLFPFILQITFVLVGTQAGRIFDVQTLKRVVPIVFGAFSIGFIVAGLVVNPLLAWFGNVSALLHGAWLALVATMFTITITARRYPVIQQAEAPPGGGRAQPAPSLKVVLSKRFVLLLLGYQVLSAFVTQVAEYALLSQATVQYTNPEALAAFLGVLLLVMNVFTVLFGFFVAGRLMSRFGVRLGLPINAAAMVVAFALILVFIPFVGLFALPILFITVGGRVADISFTNGTTTPSINTMYQALPGEERAVAQTLVEGIGVPVAFMLIGAILLVLNALPALNFAHIIVFALLCALGWLVVGTLVFRQYGSTLVRSLRRRALGDGVLNLADGSSRAVLNEMLNGSDPARMQLALDTLVQAVAPDLDDVLGQMLQSPYANTQRAALAQVEARGTTAHAATVKRLAMQANANLPQMQAAAVRALCAVAPDEAIDLTQGLLDSPSRVLRRAAAVGLLKHSGLDGIIAAASVLNSDGKSDNPIDRAMVCQVIGDVASPNFYRPLVSLLQDEDQSVQLAALAAATELATPRLLPHILPCLQDGKLRSAALNALTALGDDLLPTLSDALAGNTALDEVMVVRVVRAVQFRPSPALVDLLASHIDHPDDDVQYAVLSALQTLDYCAGDADWDAIEAVMLGEATHAARAMAARQAVAIGPETKLLRDVLSFEVERAGERLMQLLSFMYDPRAIARAETQIRYGDAKQRALALETLDVTLRKQVVAVVQPVVSEHLAHSDRLTALSDVTALPNYDHDSALRDILEDPDGVWTHGMTRAAAAYAVGKLGAKALMPSLEIAAQQDEHPVRETTMWALAQLQAAAA